MNIQIRVLEAWDVATFESLVEVFADVFEMEGFVAPPQEHTRALLARDDFFAVVAELDGQVIGGLTIYVLHQYYSTKPLAYIYDLAVLHAMQRKGVGPQLIRHATEYCSAKGFEEVFVQADRVDAHAVDFYRRTKPTAEEDVLHFYYSLGV